MALTFVKKKSAAIATGPNMKQLLTTFQKDMGETVGDFGGALKQTMRLPSGIFPLDLAIGGGIPRGKATMVWGPESSGKTNLILCLIRMHQQLFPHLTCVFCDAEHSFDPVWAKTMGVDTDKLIVLNATHAEQMVDMIEGFLNADDCGLVVVDSIAGVMTLNELNSSSEKVPVGGASAVIGRLVRKSTMAFAAAERRGNKPTLVYVNQTRYKIGVMFGDPETTPGGNALKFQIAMSIRMFGKNEKDTKVSTTMPVMKHVEFVLRKWKCPIVASAGAYDQAMVPHKGLKVGECDDWNTISEYLKQFGQLVKDDKKGWKIMGKHYDTLSAFETLIYKDPEFGQDVRQGIISAMLDQQGVPSGEVE